MLVFLTSCASRGWQLSEQIQGVDNKLQATQKTIIDNNDSNNTRVISSSTEGTQEYYLKSNIILKGEITPTSFNEPGLLLISE